MKVKGLNRFKEIFLFSDSEPNEVLIGLLHAFILPFAMLEMGHPILLFQIGASFVGFFQLYAVLYNGKLKMRKIAVQLAGRALHRKAVILFARGPPASLQRRKQKPSAANRPAALT